MSELYELGIDPFSDPNVALLLYEECEFCVGLFPKDYLDTHVRVGHKDELSKLHSMQRRLFACVDITDKVITKSKLESRLVSTIHPVHKQAADDPGSDSVSAAMSGSKSTTAVFVDETQTPSQSQSYVEYAVEVEDDTIIESYETAGPPVETDELPGPSSDPVPEPNSEDTVVVSIVGATTTPLKRKYRSKPQSEGSEQKLSVIKNPFALPYMPVIDDFPDIPTSFNTSLHSTIPNNSFDPDEVLLESDLLTKDNVKQWLHEFTDKSYTNWNIKSCATNKSRGSSLYMVYVCRFSSHYKKKPTHSRKTWNYGCQARMTFNTHGNVCLIRMSRRHNHGLGPKELSRRPVNKLTESQFQAYFTAGMRPPAARAYHKKILRSQEDFTEQMLIDTSIMPTMRQVIWLFDKYVLECCDGKRPPKANKRSQLAEIGLDDEDNDNYEPDLYLDVEGL